MPWLFWYKLTNYFIRNKLTFNIQQSFLKHPVIMLFSSTSIEHVNNALNIEMKILLHPLLESAIDKKYLGLNMNVTCFYLILIYT